MPVSEALMVALMGMAVVMAELMLLAGLIIIMSKIILTITAKRAAVNAVPDGPGSAPVIAVTLPKTQPKERIDLHNVDDKTAAMLMAIVSDESGIPLNRLRFKSIKALDDLQEGITQ